MDPELAWKLIEGHPDILAGETTKNEALYRQFVCPACRSSMQKELSTTHAFSDPSSLVARALLRCPTCRLLLDPHSGLLVSVGSQRHMPEEPMVSPAFTNPYESEPHRR
jgi:hypothetical protein